MVNNKYMETKNNKYIPLEVLAGRLSLPQKFLKDLAIKKTIPSLNVNGRLRFNEDLVCAALDEISLEDAEAAHGK